MGTPRRGLWFPTLSANGAERMGQQNKGDLIVIAEN
jgi:hypothetical protein